MIYPILNLCDFGYSKSSWQGSLPKTRVGTAADLSPEVARANVSTVQYDTEKADVWSSAVTRIFQAFMRHVPDWAFACAMWHPLIEPRNLSFGHACMAESESHLHNLYSNAHDVAPVSISI